MSNILISVILVYNQKVGQLQPVAAGKTYGLAQESYNDWERKHIADDEWDLGYKEHHYLSFYEPNG